MLRIWLDSRQPLGKKKKKKAKQILKLHVIRCWDKCGSIFFFHFARFRLLNEFDTTCQMFTYDHVTHRTTDKNLSWLKV